MKSGIRMKTPPSLEALDSMLFHVQLPGCTQRPACRLAMLMSSIAMPIGALLAVQTACSSQQRSCMQAHIECMR